MFWPTEDLTAFVTMCSWTQRQQTYYTTHWSNATIWFRCVMSHPHKWIKNS